MVGVDAHHALVDLDLLDVLAAAQMIEECGCDSRQFESSEGQHRPETVRGEPQGGSTLDKAFLIPLLVMALGFSLLFVTLHLAAMRNEILRRRVRSLQMMQASQQAA